MCNRMLVPREQLIVAAIHKNIGVSKVLDEWQKIINESLPEPRRMTKKSFTHIIRFLSHSQQLTFIKETKQRNIYYMFLTQQLSTRENEITPIPVVE